MGVMYIIVFVFIACALGSIVTVWGADSALSANFSASPLEQIEQLYNQVKKEIKDLFKAGGVLDVRKEMLDQMKQVAELDSLVDAAQGRIYFNSSNGEVLRQGVPQSANTNRAVNGYKQYIQIYDV